MSTDVESIVITCIKCGEEYASWQNIGLDSPGPDPCPRCGFTPTEDPRVYWDGLVEPLDEDEVRL